MSDAGPQAAGPALAVVEIASIARAYRVTDAIVKRAPSRLWQAYPISRGFFLVFIRGGVAEVSESYEAALEASEGVLVDSVLLPYAHDDLLATLDQRPELPKVDSLGVLETRTCVSSVRAADAAVKAAEVRLVHMQLGRGIGGKGVFAFTGELHDVQAALEAAVFAAKAEHLIATEEIPAPHGAMTLEMLGLASLAPQY